MDMIDFHSHSLLSDGVLLPSELARRAEEKGYGCIAITDHVDMVNVARIAGEISRVAAALEGHIEIKIIPGVEITHIPPALIAETVEKARGAGAEIVLVHGETPVEPVSPGTNKAAVKAKIDVLAHPGLIDDETAALAAENGVFLEISGRKGHSFSNGHVAKTALARGAGLTFGSDSHMPEDLGGLAAAEKVLRGAGLCSEDVCNVFNNMKEWVKKNG